jgi:redox-sensitive bicupin YhaK (pirin superfamily)
MGAPRYQEVAAADLPVVTQGGARVRMVAGAFGGVTGPVTEIAAQPIYGEIALDPGTEIELPVPTGHTAVAYVFEGAVAFGSGDEAAVPAVHMVVLSDGRGVTARASQSSGARFMLMAGQPIGEPIVPYGPFVMNTEQEIRQALADLRAGTFVAN